MKSKFILFGFFLFTFLSFKFPEDHSFHSKFGLEWVYFVGHLQSESGEEFGYELSFFRLSVGEKNGISKLEIFPVHFAISSVKDKKHKSFETRQRSIGNLAGYSTQRIYSGEYLFEILNEKKFHIAANPKFSKEGLDLILESKGSPLPHGKNGISIKSPKNPSIFSHYYSYPRLESRGTLIFLNKTYKISTGESWMDHEWSQEFNSNPSIVSGDTSWDWLCLSSDDGSDFVSFNFRSSKLSDSESTGIFRNRFGGIERYEKLGELTMNAIESGNWKSQKSGITYPLHWKIVFPKGFWIVRPMFNEQEFDGMESTGNVYWEGMVKAEGEIDGKKRTAKGYLELKGYVNSSKWWKL